MSILRRKNSNTTTSTNSKGTFFAALFSFALVASLSSCSTSSGCGYWGQNKQVKPTKNVQVHCQIDQAAVKEI